MMTNVNLTSGESAATVVEKSLPSAKQLYAAYSIGRALHGLKISSEKSWFAPVGSFREIEALLGILRIEMSKVLQPQDAFVFRHTVTRYRDQWEELLCSEWFNDAVSDCHDDVDSGAYDPFAGTVRMALGPMILLRDEMLSYVSDTPCLVNYIQLGEAVGELIGTVSFDGQESEAAPQGANDVATKQSDSETLEICPDAVVEEDDCSLAGASPGMPIAQSPIAMQSLPEQPVKFEQQIAFVRQLTRRLGLVLFADDFMKGSGQPDGDVPDCIDTSIRSAIDDWELLSRPEAPAGKPNGSLGRPPSATVAARNRAMLNDRQQGMRWPEIADKYGLKKEAARKGAKSAEKMRDKRSGLKSTQDSCQSSNTSTNSKIYKSLYPEEFTT